LASSQARNSSGPVKNTAGRSGEPPGVPMLVAMGTSLPAATDGNEVEVSLVLDAGVVIAAETTRGVLTADAPIRP